MTKKVIALAATALLAAFATQAQTTGTTETVKHKEAPVPAQVKSPRIEAKNELMHVSYGQPAKKEREIFGALVPYGKVWRTGANMSTDITFPHDVDFAGTHVKAGTYSLFTIPNENEWTVILNSKPQQLGASQYEANKANNVAEVKVPVSKVALTELFTITPTANSLDMMWDEVKVSVPVSKK